MLDEIRALRAYQNLLAKIPGDEPIDGLGLMRSARLPLLAALWQDLNLPILWITDRTDRALAMLDELSFWMERRHIRIFPEPNPLFYEQAAWGTVTRRDRLNSLTALSVYHLPGGIRPDKPPVILAPLRAVMSRALPRRDFLKNSRTLKNGQAISLEILQRSWMDIGYQPVDTVLEPGQFAQRGGILDIWIPAEDFPARIEFFGDEIDTIRRFDPATQRTIARLERLMITPASEVLPGYARAVNLAIEKVEEFYLPLVHPMPASILDYLPRPALVIVDDLNYLAAIANEIEEQSVHLREESVKEGTLVEGFPLPYLTWSEIVDELSTVRWIDFGHSSGEEASPLAQAFQPGARYGGRLKPFFEFLIGLCDQNQPVMVVSRQVSRLKGLWEEQGCEINPPQFFEGSLSEGWQLILSPERRLHLLTDSEIFGWERPQPRTRARPIADSPESTYADFKPGNWVVHVDYGIGRFTGLVQRVLDGVEREFLCLEYADGDQLFVPVHQADRLNRYIGSSGETPTPTRLAGNEWHNTRQRVREAVIEVAQDLLELYSRRQVVEGFKFGADTSWQQDLEAAFPYVETEDQLNAISEVKRDMEQPRPMDRLLCGDVGYGKTEIALRAAFKAVMDGKQVAILVPTTVLAQQHYETFRQRLAAFPVQVEMLSRFRSPREQDEIILRAALGEVDIVIGTHRLLQADVVFKDLGLLIIDEEQRFGVSHKEHFKRMRTEVDVLTLTATPIPRTLYMALTGVRDISVINTPPAERLPIITHIGPYSQRIARQAILREMERGGQVFFVHNRVQTIRAMERHLNKLVPESRVGVAHGQMHEGELARVMQDFTHGRIDVLLCTSIIESGLDIPNANTLIVDRGDTFGLAQLYQLRGRVGRGAQRAYAYFFRHRHKAPTPEGQERLEVIAENTQLGAGYSIAMRDLEMRGAGELLGNRQHGYIASVGFHLYTRLLAQAVRQLRQVSDLTLPVLPAEEIRELRMAVTVDLPLASGIPSNYVTDQQTRLNLYRRIADVHDQGELDALAVEFEDRFGALPEQVHHLFYQMRVKLMAEEAGLIAVAVENDQIVLRFPLLPETVQARNLPPVGGAVRAGKNAYRMPYLREDPAWQETLLQTLSAVKAVLNGAQIEQPNRVGEN
ncbi:MAG: transcription-repair coupling factor [Bellilinea sp.]|jgi:transcription-repair coupling factor (superfamily II helicase)